MKVKKNTPLQLLLALALVFTVFISFSVVAQTPPQPLAPNGPPQAPIDGGLTILLIAGAAYGIKKSIKKN